MDNTKGKKEIKKKKYVKPSIIAEEKMTISFCKPIDEEPWKKDPS